MLLRFKKSGLQILYISKILYLPLLLTNFEYKILLLSNDVPNILVYKDFILLKESNSSFLFILYKINFNIASL